MIRFIAILIVASITTSASACNRCGRAQCIYAAKVVAPVAHHVAPVAAVVQPNVFVIQNAGYPAPLVPQGQTLYQSSVGYQAGAATFLDKDRFFTSEQQLQQAADKYSQLRHARYSESFDRTVAAEAPALEIATRGNAGSQLLRAAGFDPSANAAGFQRQAVALTFDAAGNPSVTPLSQQQAATLKYEQRTVERTTTTVVPPAANEPELGGKWPVATKYCLKCHDQGLPAPKGGFYLGEDPDVARGMREKWFDITDRVSTPGPGQMPPADAPQMTPEEKSQLFNEISAMIKNSKPTP